MCCGGSSPRIAIRTPVVATIRPSAVQSLASIFAIIQARKAAAIPAPAVPVTIPARAPIQTDLPVDTLPVQIPSQPTPLASPPTFVPEELSRAETAVKRRAKSTRV